MQWFLHLGSNVLVVGTLVVIPILLSNYVVHFNADIWFYHLFIDDLVALMPLRYWKMESQLNLWIQVRKLEIEKLFHTILRAKCIHFFIKHAISWTKMYFGLLINLIRFLGITFLSCIQGTIPFDFLFQKKKNRIIM